MIILGDPEVGKSAFNRYCSTRFEDSVEQLHEQIYGVSFAVKILRQIDVDITLVVWNFTGQDRYKNIQPHYMKGVSGILLVFDITRRETFVQLPEWIHFIKETGEIYPIFLIGSKADLFYQKAISDEEIEKFVKSNNLQGYYEVSFKTGLNVELVIQKMSELIYQNRIKKQNIPIGFKLERPIPDRPIILDEQKIISDFILTINTLSEMVFEDISRQIVTLEQFIDDIKRNGGDVRSEWVMEEIEKVSQELTDRNKHINELLSHPPVPLLEKLKKDLMEEWKSKRDILLYRILVFKDVFSFVNKA
ncbi:MAG: Rab family GTPase [Candidatus Helarchaeota archaeon]